MDEIFIDDLPYAIIGGSEILNKIINVSKNDKFYSNSSNEVLAIFDEPCEIFHVLAHRASPQMRGRYIIPTDKANKTLML